MNTEQRIFLENFNNILTIHQAKMEAIKYWGDDIPVTVLFGELGRFIAKNFDRFSDEEINYIFKMIEKGMASPLSNAIATGLLEALGGEILNNPDILEKINIALGRLSKKYLTDWNDWLQSQ